jgi:polyhydroxybutyrate depolymerase
MRSVRFLLAAALLACACTSASPAPPPDPSTHTFGGSRPVPLVRAPDKYDPRKPVSLVLMLHGYGSDALQTNVLFGLQYIADDENILLVVPEGTVDSTGKHFWAAGNVCCDFDHSGVDDVKYLTDLVKEVKQYYAVDPKRVFAVGVSNGGFMALGLACEAADVFAGVVSYAGAGPLDASTCKPTEPVAVLQIHGTADTTVPYGGGTLAASVRPGVTVSLPSVAQTVGDWAKRDGCSAAPDTSLAPINLVDDLPGDETKLQVWNGCAGTSQVKLASIEGGSHVDIGISQHFPAFAWPFLRDHAKK